MANEHRTIDLFLISFTGYVGFDRIDEAISNGHYGS